MKRTTCSKAQRVRTSWFPVILRVEGGVKEVHVIWRYVDTSVGLFSCKGNSSPTRPPWDYITDCQYEILKNSKGEQHDYFTLKNRLLQRRGFRVDELNPFLWTLNDFTSKMIELKTTGRKKLLALYFSLLL